jgi:hypothetical protein
MLLTSKSLPLQILRNQNNNSLLKLCNAHNCNILLASDGTSSNCRFTLTEYDISNYGSSPVLIYKEHCMKIIVVTFTHSTRNYI